MPNLSDLKQSKFLRKNDVEPPLLVTVQSYEQINVAQEDAPEEMKWCLWFSELDKPLVLNQTNGNIMAQIAGSEEFDAWIGKEVEIYFDPTVSFGGQLKGGIRLRPKYVPVAAARPAARTAPARPAPVAQSAPQETPPLTDADYPAAF